MAKLIKLTRPDNESAWVMASAVEIVMPVIPGLGPPTARTSVACGSATIYVIEEPNVVVSLIDGADG